MSPWDSSSVSDQDSPKADAAGTPEGEGPKVFPREPDEPVVTSVKVIEPIQRPVPDE